MMKTLLVPIDFSEVSENAAQYAADFANKSNVERIILLKSFYVSVYAQLLPSADFLQLSADDIQEERRKIESHLKKLSQKLLKNCNSSIKIEIAISEEPLLHSIHQLIAEEHPDLLIVGGDSSDAEPSFIGTQLISIAKTSPIPVLIIPSNTRYQQIEHALVPCDFAAVSRLELLKEFPVHQWLHPELMVLYVDPQQKHLEEGQDRTEILKKILKNYDYKVYFSEDRNTVHGILDFAENNDLQLIIALPGRHSFFYSLTHQSITEALSLNANYPVLLLK